jgi:CIC family chloride channel protein
MKKDEFLHFVFIPLVIGLLGGFSAILFRWLINFFENIYTKIDFLHNNILYLISMPLIFYFSYILVTKLLFNTSNVTLDNIAKKISIHRGNFSILKGFLVLFLTSLNIGFGVPLGREAPIAKLGGLFGEVFLKLLNLSKINIPIYLAASVSAAIAATFNAPLGGIILGIEIIIGKINTYIVIPMIVSSATATMFAEEFLGDYIAFYVPHLEFSDKYFYIVPIEGVLFAFLAVLIFNFLNMFRELKVALRHQWSKVVIFNGILVGLLIYLVPQSMGVGYEHITLLYQDVFSESQVFSITIVKIIVVIISLGSGLFGGLMSPSIFIGTFGGYFIGSFFSSFGIDPKVSALIGSIAMLSAMSRAPLRSTVLIVELTHSYQMLIPSLIVGSISSFIVAKFEPGGYFKRSLIQKGIDIENPRVVKFIEHLNFKKYYKELPTLKEETNAYEAFRIFKKSHSRYLAVVDDNGYLKGVVSVRDFRKHYFKKKKVTVSEIMSKHPIVFKENSKIEEIVKILGLLTSSYIPLVSKDNKYITMIDMNKIFKDISMHDRYKIL